MGIFKAFDRSPEAMAAGLDRLRQELEAQVGLPIEVFLAGLAPPGALEAALAPWTLSRRAHRATGGATDRKHHALLVVTGDGALRLFKTKAGGGTFTIVEQVRAWPLGGAQVRMLRQGWTVGIVVDDGAGEPLAFEMVSDRASVAALAEPFAARVGTVVEER